MNLKTKLFTLMFAAALMSIACSEDDLDTRTGEGTLYVKVWGEAFIEQGIPEADPPDIDGFVDGFSVTFDKFLIALSDVSVAEEGAAPAVESTPQTIWDLTGEGPFFITDDVVPSGTYHHTAYTIAPAASGAAPGNADAEDVEMMIADGLGVFVSGAATDGDVSKTFKWGFDTETVYDPCHSTAEVDDGGDATVQITVHGDHLFYDNAVSESPSLRFNDIALADADADDTVTKNELLSYGIATLPNYGVGNLDMDNLWDFIAHMTTTLGHIDGEGHCE